MATRYWVGGTGNWSDATNHWSDADGGTPGAGFLPTSSDNVIFNNNSATGTFNVTVDITTAACNDFTVSITDAAKKMTFTNSGSNIPLIYGSWSNPTSLYYARSAAGSTTFKATTTGKTIQCNGVTLTGGNATFDGVGGEWTLQDALTASNGIVVTNGSLITGNNNITTSTLSSSNTNTRSITLGTMTATLTGSTGYAAVNFATSTNLTYTNNAAAIVCSGAFVIFAGGGQSFGATSFTSAADSSAAITGANTFTSLSFTSRSATGFKLISFGANQTVSGTATFGTVTNQPMRRMLICSNDNATSPAIIVGTQRTLTVATLATAYDLDFRDIVAAGASSPWSDSSRTYRWGDCLNNSSITFNAGANRYWYTAAGTGGNWSSAAWETTAGGTTPATTNIPLAQDTVIVQTTGLNDGATITIDANFQIGALDFSARTTTSYDMVLATGTTTPTIYKDVTYASGVTTSGTGVITFAGQGTTQTITSAGISFTQPWTINSPSGTVKLADNTTIGSGLATTLTAGTFDLNGKTYSTGTFVNTGTRTRAITFGTSATLTIAGSGATAFNSTGSGFTTTGTTSTISMTSASAKTFVGGGYTYNAALNQGGAGALTISGSNTFSNITNTYKATGATTITFTAGTTQTVSTFTASGEAGRLLTLQSSSAGAKFTLSDVSGQNSVSYCGIKDSTATGGAVWLSFTSNGNVDNGNNTGWDFSAPDVITYTTPIQLRSFTERRGFS